MSNNSSNKSTSAVSGSKNSAAKPKRPVVWVSGEVEGLIGKTGRELGELVAQTNQVYLRGDQIMEVININGIRKLEPLSVERAICLIDKIAATAAVTFTQEGEVDKEIPKVPSQRFTKLILNSDEFMLELAPISVISPCPVMLEQAGKTVIVHSGQTIEGVHAYGGTPTKYSSVKEAKAKLKELLVDFNFLTKSDKSRAIASLITPALVQGGLLRGRAPIDLSEADQSQAGKGMRNKLLTTIYCQNAAMVNFTGSNYGGAEQSFDSALVAGKNFLALDNVRGKVNSQKFETFMTELRYSAKPPYSKFIEIDPARTVVLMTSNSAEMTEDLANRCVSISIRKQPKDHVYATFGDDECDLLTYVERNQPDFLGAVFCIVEKWHEMGCLEDTEARQKHDFRKWAGVLNYIVTEILDEPDMFEGYEAVRMRLYNSDMIWLRGTAMALLQTGEPLAPMATQEMLEMLEDWGHSDLVPGLRNGEGIDESRHLKKALRMTGRILKSLFKSGDQINIEDLEIRKETKRVKRADGKGYREHSVYSFARVIAA